MTVQFTYIINSLGRLTGVQGCNVVPLSVYTTLLKLLNPFELSKHSTKSTWSTKVKNNDASKWTSFSLLE